MSAERQSHVLRCEQLVSGLRQLVSGLRDVVEVDAVERPGNQASKRPSHSADGPPRRPCPPGSGPPPVSHRQGRFRPVAGALVSAPPSILLAARFTDCPAPSIPTNLHLGVRRIPSPVRSARAERRVPPRMCRRSTSPRSRRCSAARDLSARSDRTVADVAAGATSQAPASGAQARSLEATASQQARTLGATRPGSSTLMGIIGPGRLNRHGPVRGAKILRRVEQDLGGVGTAHSAAARLLGLACQTRSRQPARRRRRLQASSRRRRGSRP